MLSGAAKSARRGRICIVRLKSEKFFLLRRHVSASETVPVAEEKEK